MKFFTELTTADSAQTDRLNRTPAKRKRRTQPVQRRAAQDEAEAILRKAKILV